MMMTCMYEGKKHHYKKKVFERLIRVIIKDEENHAWSRPDKKKNPEANPSMQVTLLH